MKGARRRGTEESEEKETKWMKAEQANGWIGVFLRRREGETTGGGWRRRRGFFHVRIVSDRPKSQVSGCDRVQFIYINAESPVINENRRHSSIVTRDLTSSLVASSLPVTCTCTLLVVISSIDRYSIAEKWPILGGILFLFFFFFSSPRQYYQFDVSLVIDRKERIIKKRMNS